MGAVIELSLFKLIKMEDSTMTNQEKTNSQVAEETKKANGDRLRRLTPASLVQVAAKAMEAIIKFDYEKFLKEAKYEASPPSAEQISRIVVLKDQLFELKAELKTAGSGKSIEQRLTSTIKIVKAMNPKIKGNDLIEMVKTAYSSAYNSSGLIGYEDKIAELCK